MTDDDRVVSLDDDIVEDEPTDEVDDVVDAAPTPVTRRSGATSGAAAESRDWDEQGFDANRYDERPPHWEP